MICSINMWCTTLPKPLLMSAVCLVCQAPPADSLEEPLSPPAFLLVSHNTLNLTLSAVPFLDN